MLAKLMTVSIHFSISKIGVRCQTEPPPHPLSVLPVLPSSHLCFQILFSFYHLLLSVCFTFVSQTRILILWESGIWVFFFPHCSISSHPAPNRINICRMKEWACLEPCGRYLVLPGPYFFAASRKTSSPSRNPVDACVLDLDILDSACHALGT